MGDQIYIIISNAEPKLDGKSAANPNKRAVFFDPVCGRRRFYRQSMANSQKGMKLLLFKRKSRAEEVCFIVNNAYNDNFKVEPWNK